jgi:proteasome activator subunit 4
LNHSFQNVRERLGSILTNIFEADLQFAGAAPPECPRIKDFIDESMPQMEVLLRESPPTVKPAETMEVDGEEAKSPEGSDYEKAVRLFKTSE